MAALWLGVGFGVGPAPSGALKSEPKRTERRNSFLIHNPRINELQFNLHPQSDFIAAVDAKLVPCIVNAARKCQGSFRKTAMLPEMSTIARSFTVQYLTGKSCISIM
jgi:hypothetical protein